MENLDQQASAMLGELGAVALVNKGVITAAQKPAVQQQIQKAVAQTTAAKFMTKDQALMAAQIENLPEETKARWKAGALRYKDSVKYVKRMITSANSMFEVFNDTLDKVIGITNLSKQKLDVGEVLNIRRIELQYDNGAGITEKTAKYAPLTASDDAALLNAEVELKIGGVSMIKIPANSFVQPDSSAIGSPANGFNLKAPILVDDKQEIQIYIHFPQAMTSNATNDAIEFKLIGAGLSSKK